MRLMVWAFVLLLSSSAAFAETAWRYSPDTGFLVGPETVPVSPLDGMLLVGRNTTLTEPPELSAGQTAQWDGSAWNVVTDNRGKIFYRKSNGGEQKIGLDNVVPDTLTDKPKPSDCPFCEWDESADDWVENEVAVAEAEAAIKRGDALHAADSLMVKQLVFDEDLTDEERLSIIGFYPLWSAGLAVSVDDLYRYEGGLYKAVQAHTTQADWEPPNVPAIWTPVVTPGTIGAWMQLTGAQDAYQIDDLVTHNGQTWISLVDNNVWEPGAVGSESLWAAQG